VGERAFKLPCVLFFFSTYTKSNPHLTRLPKKKFAPMPRSERARVNALLQGPHRIRENHTASYATLVLQGAGGEDRRGRIAVAQAAVLMQDGELTAAGRMYERLTQTQLRAPAPWIGEPFLVGNNQRIRVDGGRRRLLSTFVRDKEKLTTWGKKWYRENPEERIVHVPVRVTYVRRDKSHYQAPESTLAIPRTRQQFLQCDLWKPIFWAARRAGRSGYLPNRGALSEAPAGVEHQP